MNIIIISILSGLNWILFSNISGIIEAWFEKFYRSQSSVKMNVSEHVIFVLLRCNVMWLNYISTGKDWQVCLALACMFPFFHDGQYYLTRHKLDMSIYLNGWMDYSTTSTAWTDKILSGFNRTVPGKLRVILCVLAFSFLWYHYLNL